LEVLVRLHSNDWRLVASQLSGKARTAKQCRERWVHCLSPSLSHVPWTIEAELKMFELQRELGNKWLDIAG
jgi:myb proto-oncogene protein